MMMWSCNSSCLFCFEDTKDEVKFMEKYGVQIEDDGKTKEAGLSPGKVGRCPDCGEEIAQPGYCRRCGSKPFEKEPEKSSWE